MGRLIEGVWDCAYCNTTKIRGSIRACPHCGRQRDTNTVFYMDNPTNYVEESTAKTINRNPDWLCSYCDALNSDSTNECYMCGSSREDSKKNYFEHRAEVDARRKLNCQNLNSYNKSNCSENDKENACPNNRDQSECVDRNENVDSRYDTSHNEQNNQEIHHNAKDYCEDNSRKRSALTKLRWGNILKVSLGIIITAMVIFGLIKLFTPKVQEVTVSEFSWERSINIEEYTTVNRNDWYLPADGRLLYTQQEIRSYQQVLDHYETKTRTYTEQVLDHYESYVSGYRDLGNGYFEEIVSQRPVYRTETRTETYQEPVYRTEPVYDTKYYYEIDVWQHLYYSTSSGYDKNPYWEEPELKELQRENGRSETYYIAVINEDEEVKTYQFNFDTWSALEVGEKIKIKTTILGTAELIIDESVAATGGR